MHCNMRHASGLFDHLVGADEYRFRYGNAERATRANGRDGAT